MAESKTETGTQARRSYAMKVYCSPAARAALEAKAKTAGMSLSAYLRAVGAGYPVKSLLDHHRVEELVRINGDLGRLGGLLKLWLTDDERTRAFGVSTVRALLGKIENTQAQMVDVMRQVVVPKGRR